MKCPPIFSATVLQHAEKAKAQKRHLLTISK
jgi:hypothetical protein